MVGDVVVVVCCLFFQVFLFSISLFFFSMLEEEKTYFLSLSLISYELVGSSSSRGDLSF